MIPSTRVKFWHLLAFSAWCLHHMWCTCDHRQRVRSVHLDHSTISLRGRRVYIEVDQQGTCLQACSLFVCVSTHTVVAFAHILETASSFWSSSSKGGLGMHYMTANESWIGSLGVSRYQALPLHLGLASPVSVTQWPKVALLVAGLARCDADWC